MLEMTAAAAEAAAAAAAAAAADGYTSPPPRGERVVDLKRVSCSLATSRIKSNPFFFVPTSFHDTNTEDTERRISITLVSAQRRSFSRLALFSVAEGVRAPVCVCVCVCVWDGSTRVITAPRARSLSFILAV